MRRDDKAARRIYKIWWEFLTLSNKYKEFCEIMDLALKKSGRDYFYVIDSMYEKLEWANKNHQDFSDPWDMSSYYYFFGNVHRLKFWKWWRKKKHSVLFLSVFDFSDPDASDLIELQLSDVFRYFRKGDKSYIPTLRDIVKMFTHDRDFFYVGIPKTSLNAAKISKEITRIRKKYVTRKKRKDDPFGGPILDDHVFAKQLERYLDVYKKHQKGLTITDIIKKRHRKDILEQTVREPEIQDLQSKYSADVKRAERIIKNIEIGCFPGPYQPERKK